MFFVLHVFLFKNILGAFGKEPIREKTHFPQYCTVCLVVLVVLPNEMVYTTHQQLCISEHAIR